MISEITTPTNSPRPTSNDCFDTLIASVSKLNLSKEETVDVIMEQEFGDLITKLNNMDLTPTKEGQSQPYSPLTADHRAFSGSKSPKKFHKTSPQKNPLMTARSLIERMVTVRTNFIQRAVNVYRMFPGELSCMIPYFQ